MPDRRLSIAAAVLIASGAAHLALACPVDSPDYLCAGLDAELFGADDEAALARRADQLRAALAKRPTADQFAEQARQLEILGWSDDSAAAERAALVAAWLERFPDDPRAHLARLGSFDFGSGDAPALRALVERFPDSVAVAEALVDHLLDARTVELFDATDDVRWRLALCERLRYERADGCTERLVAEWSFARATPAERQRLVPHLAAGRRWEELRAIVADEPDPERAAALRASIRTFAGFDDDPRVACDLPADLVGPIPEEERDDWIVACGSDDEKLDLAREILGAGRLELDAELDFERRWTLRSLVAVPAVEALLRARLEREPARGELWAILADRARGLDPGEERELVEAWWRSAPDDLEALDRLAELERESGDPRFALQLLTERFVRTPSCGRAGRAEEILDFHLEGGDLASVHAFADALATEGGALAEVGRLARARAELAAGAPDPLEIGQRALDLGATALARRTFEAAVRADEASPEAWAGLGRALAAAGERRPAERALRRALDLRFDDPEALRALAELRAADDREPSAAARR